MPAYIKSTDFEKEVLQADKPVFVELTAPERCPPCKALEPELEKLEADIGDQVKIVKIHADHARDPNDPVRKLAGELGIRGIPALLLYKDGNLVAQGGGYAPKDALKGWIAESFGLDFSAGTAPAAPKTPAP